MERHFTKEDQRRADNQMRALIADQIAETARIQKQMRWQMPVYMVSFIGAIIAVLMVFAL
ncbi:MAG: hypothetical protein AAF826_01410 [Pseudomonadota bacterium]